MRKITLFLIGIITVVLAVSLLTSCDKLSFTSPNAKSSQNGGGSVDTQVKHTITFDSDGGTEVSAQEILDGKKGRIPDEPKKAGYTFLGWYNGEEKWFFSQNIVTKDILLVAKWEAKENTLAFDGNGATEGTMPSVSMLTNSQGTLADNQFVREGYTFLGWSSTPNGQVEYSDGAQYTMGTDNRYTLYAVWSTDDYVVTYELNGGENDKNNPFGFTTESLPLTLRSAWKNNCVFEGWYTSSDFTGEPVTSIDAVGSIKLYAKFTEGTSGLTYDVYDDYAEVTGYTGDSESVIIPEYYEGLPVSSIDEKAFFGCSQLKSVTMTEKMLSIGRNAFMDCTSLKSVDMGSRVNKISYGAFYNCSSLESIVIPQRVTEISISMLEGCTALESIELLGEISSIGNYSFKDCTSLKEIVIPNTVSSIGTSAFYNCSALTDVTIGEGVESIGMSSFELCKQLQAIVIPDSVTSMGMSAFRYCSSLKSAVIGNGLDNVSDSAFRKCTALTDVTFGEGIKVIHNYAFQECEALSNFSLPQSLYMIGDYAFNGCDSIVSITIGDDVQSLGKYAFRDCAGLESVVIGKGITAISYYAFGGCKALKTVELSDDTASIGGWAFAYCQALESIYIPKSVGSIGERALYACSSLESIEVDADNQNYKAIDGSLYSNDGRELVAYAVGKKDTAFTTPEGVESIAERAFYGSQYLESVTIGSDVTSIGKAAFAGCTQLTSVTLEASTGWWYASKATATSGTAVEDSTMSNASTVALYFRETFSNYYWKK